MEDSTGANNAGAAAAHEIVFEADGIVYTLGFDRASAAHAESAYGISYAEVISGKTYVVENLFRASFAKNHPFVDVDVIDSLWRRLEGKSELYKTLASMYIEAAASVLNDPDEETAISWMIR